MRLATISAFPLFSPLLKHTTAQWTESDLHFHPERLVWVKQSWFQALLDELAQGRLPQMLIPDICLEECNRSCWESDYSYTYWHGQAKQCLCSNEYTFAHNVNETNLQPPQFNKDTFASSRFTRLNSNFSTYPCIANLTEISYRNSTADKVEDCIASCGDPTEERQSVFTIVRPTLTQLGPDYFLYDYECQCFEVYQVKTHSKCGYGILHQYGRFLSV